LVIKIRQSRLVLTALSCSGSYLNWHFYTRVEASYDRQLQTRIGRSEWFRCV